MSVQEWVLPLVCRLEFLMEIELVPTLEPLSAILLEFATGLRKGSLMECPMVSLLETVMGNLLASWSGKLMVTLLENGLESM